MRGTFSIAVTIIGVGFVSALAACGGNGFAGGGVAPQPTQAYAPNTGDFQRSTVSPMATETPPAESQYIQDTWSGIYPVQIFDNHKNKGGISQEQAMQDGPLYAALWGSNSPQMVQAWRTNNPTLPISMYLPVGTDASVSLFGNLGHPLSWWQANHPDWILYECDRSTVAFVSGLTSVPLDITNPDVINYLLNLVGGYAEQNGYSAVGLDLVSLNNDTGGTQDGQHGCGVFANVGGVPTWTQKFSGHTVDSAWANAMLSYLSTARTYLHGQPRSLGIWGNNVPADITLGDPNEQQLVADLDVLFDESGFARYGKYSSDAEFNNTVAWARYAQGLGKGFMDVNEWQNETSVTNAQLDYVLSTYVMAKEQAAVVFTAPYGEYGFEHYFDQYKAAIGAPCAEMYGGPSYHGLGRLAYFRQFSFGLSAVNTSSTTPYTVKLPQTVYTDVATGAVRHSAKLTLAPSSGVLLTVAKHGCAGAVQ
ncbi:MAG TPA: hypothetical protein VKT51_01450 [Candidatus Eremiobacteraceae bacterium]|nr:hypothetical protein [Candidatus Eremiobacteraceae bacterium]